MFRLILLVVSVALADSLNPATVGPALFMATGRRARARVEAFAAGFFAVNLAGGIVIAVGPGQLVLSALPHPDPKTKYVIALAGGAVALVFAAVLWRGGHRVAALGRRGSGESGQSALALGAGLAAVELPTALPYLAVIATIVESNASLPEQLGLVALFNVLFVLPLLAIIVILGTAGERATVLLGDAGEWIRVRGPILLAAVVLVIGVALVAYGLHGLILL